MGADLLRQAGHDAASAHEQGLCSSSDRALAETCRREGRCLVRLDLDFANPLLFPPRDLPGIAVLRLPTRPSADDLVQAMNVLARGLAGSAISGRPWIVDRGRIREYQPEDEAEG